MVVASGSGDVAPLTSLTSMVCVPGTAAVLIWPTKKTRPSGYAVVVALTVPFHNSCTCDPASKPLAPIATGAPGAPLDGYNVTVAPVPVTTVGGVIATAVCDGTAVSDGTPVAVSVGPAVAVSVLTGAGVLVAPAIVVGVFVEPGITVGVDVAVDVFVAEFVATGVLDATAELVGIGEDDAAVTAALNLDRSL